MKLRRMSFIFAVAAGLLVAATSQAQGKGSARGMKKFGVVGYYGILPNTVGAHLGFHLGSLARFEAGYLATGTQGAVSGAFRLFVPSWNLSPTVGVRAQYPLATGSALQLRGEGGLEWQTKVGLNLGAGVTYGLSNATGMGYYATLGWFFGKGK